MLCYYTRDKITNIVISRDLSIIISLSLSLYYMKLVFTTNFSYCGIYLNLKKKTKLLKEGFSELFSVFERFSSFFF